MIPANDLLDLRGVGQRAESWRWVVVDRSGSQMGDLHPFVGATISNQTSANVMRSVRGVQLRQNDIRAVNTLVDRLMVVMLLDDGSEDPLSPGLGGWPCGVFHFSDPSLHRGSQRNIHSATLMDGGFVLDVELGRSFHVPQGGSLRTALVQLIELAGIVDFEVGPSDQVAGEVINWRIGTRIVQVLREICRLMGFHPPYFDNRGRLVARPPTPLEPGRGHVYDLGGPRARIVADTIDEASNLLTAPNVFVVVGNGIGDSEVVARSYIDSRMPHSVANIGYERPKTITVQGLQDTAHAQRLADTYAASDPGQLEQTGFQSLNDPRHDTFDVVEYDGELWREVGWSMTCSAGSLMPHDLVKQIFDEQGLPIG